MDQGGAAPSAGQSTAAPRALRAPLNRDVARVRVVGGLFLPRAPPAREHSSTLALAGQHYNRLRMQALAAGKGDMALRVDLTTLMAVGDAVQESVDYGVNSNTAQKDDRAWLFWEVVCDSQGTSPFRTSADVRDYPDKNAHLLAVLLMYAFAVCVPTDNKPHQQFARQARARSRA